MSIHQARENKCINAHCFELTFPFFIIFCSICMAVICILYVTCFSIYLNFWYGETWAIILSKRNTAIEDGQYLAVELNLTYPVTSSNSSLSKYHYIYDDYIDGIYSIIQVASNYHNKQNHGANIFENLINEYINNVQGIRKNTSIYEGEKIENNIPDVHSSSISIINHTIYTCTIHVGAIDAVRLRDECSHQYNQSQKLDIMYLLKDPFKIFILKEFEQSKHREQTVMTLIIIFYFGFALISSFIMILIFLVGRRKTSKCCGIQCYRVIKNAFQSGAYLDHLSLVEDVDATRKYTMSFYADTSIRSDFTEYEHNDAIDYGNNHTLASTGQEEVNSFSESSKNRWFLVGNILYYCLCCCFWSCQWGNNHVGCGWCDCGEHIHELNHSRKYLLKYLRKYQRILAATAKSFHEKIIWYTKPTLKRYCLIVILPYLIPVIPIVFTISIITYLCTLGDIPTILFCPAILCIFMIATYIYSRIFIYFFTTKLILTTDRLLLVRNEGVGSLFMKYVFIEDIADIKQVLSKSRKLGLELTIANEPDPLIISGSAIGDKYSVYQLCQLLDQLRFPSPKKP